MEGQSLARLARTPRLPDWVDVAFATGLGLAALAIAVGALERPTRLVLLVAVGAVVVAAIARLDFAILLVVATAPLEAAFANGPGGISITKVAGGLLLISFVVYVARAPRPLLLDRSYGIVLGILALAALSSLQALDTGAGLSTTIRYASFVGVYIIVSEVGDDPALQRRIAWVVAVTASISAGLGLSNYFNGSQQYAQLPYSNQNDFAFILATAVPLMFWLLSTRRALRPLVGAMIGIVCAAILLSLSRGTFLGLGAGFLFFIATDRRRVRLTLAGGAVALIAIIVVIQTNPARFQSAIFAKQQVASENVTTRFEAWGAAARLMADHPFLGVGPGNFQLYYNSLTGRPPGTLLLTVAHDAYLEFGAELGLLGMALFIVYLVVVFTRLTTAVREGIGEPDFAQALRISLVIAAVCAIFLSEQYFLPFWLIGGLATATWARGRRAGETPSVTASG
jgi:O-antigen ligase